MYQQHKKLAAASKTLYHVLTTRGHGRHSGCDRLYEFVTPNKTHYDVSIDPAYHHIRRFTNDGKYLVCFAASQDGLQLFWFNGAVDSHCLEPDASASNGDLFRRFFTPKYKRTCPLPPGHLLCTDFCLFTSSNMHMILVSTGPASADRPASQHDTQITETLVNVADYQFHIVNVETGETVSAHGIPAECIPIADHSGVSICGDLFAVLLVLSQDICIFRICPRGILNLLQRISRDLQPGHATLSEFMQPAARATQSTDQAQTSGAHHTGPGRWITGAELESMLPMDMPVDYQGDAERVLPYNGFKDTLLRWLFKHAKDAGKWIAMQHFYSHFGWYESLQLWRMQFIDRHTFLIKLVSHKSLLLLTRRQVNWSDIRTLFVVFDIEKSCIVDAFENSSAKVADIIFSNPTLMEQAAHMSEMYNDTRIAIDTSSPRRQLTQLISMWARQADTSAAMMKLSKLLPTPPASQPECPYFDRSLFVCTGSAVGHGWYEPCVRAIRFYSRRSGELKFAIGAQEHPEHPDNDGGDDNGNPPLPRMLMVVIPHPVQPFMITRHRRGSVTTNFHVCNPV